MPPANADAHVPKSVGLGDKHAVSQALSDASDSPDRVESFICRLQRGRVCPWCCMPLRMSPDGPTPEEEAGVTEHLPPTVIDDVRQSGSRRYFCDHSRCEKRALLDRPDPSHSRDRGQLHTHLDNLLRTLRSFYDLPLDEAAAHDALEDAITDDENGGKDTFVLAAGVAGALSEV